MTADVYATVAEAYEGGRYEWQHEFGGTADLWGARAAVDALAGMGDVTDEQIGDAVSWDYAGKVAAVRALIAQTEAAHAAFHLARQAFTDRAIARAVAAEALIREAVDEALEASAQHLQGEAERESTGARRLYLSQAAVIVRSHKGQA
jgi:hypothetical protein